MARPASPAAWSRDWPPASAATTPQDPAFRLGQGLGQAGIGVVQMVVGGGGEVLGVGLDLSGVGTPAGALVGVGATGLLLNGAYAVRGGVRRLTEVVISTMTEHRWSFDPPGPWPHQPSGQRQRAALGSATVKKPGEATIAGGGAPRKKGPVRSPNGCTGNPDHQCTVARLVDLAQQEFPDLDRYEVLQNKSIARYTGGQIRRRPDVSVIDKQTGDVVKVYEAARMKNGAFVPRELLKVQEYKQAGIPFHMELVR